MTLLIALTLAKVLETILTIPEDKRGSRMMLSSPIPPPPPPKEMERNECPCCGSNPCVIPACLPTGVMGCYGCLVRYTREHGICCITGKPIKEEHIVRLFDE